MRVPRPTSSSSPHRFRAAHRRAQRAAIIIDDLRPELPGPWGHEWVHAPHMRALANSSTVFRRAYCQIAVCSPSRISFLTGRRPTTTRSFNFMDHFRQSDCGKHTPGARIAGARRLATSAVSERRGGSGQCCTTCTLTLGCSTWWWDGRTCHLYAAGGRLVVSGAAGVAGQRGVAREWLSLPQAFRRSGWLTMGSGKVFHTEEGGTGPTAALRGVGMPPNQDPPSCLTDCR